MTNVYRIGVNIAMASNSAQVLGVLSRDLLGVNAKVGQLNKGFSRMKLAIGGAFAVAGGAMILAGMGKLIGSGKELADQQGKMYAAGLSNKEVAEATARAWQMSATIMGSRVHENLAAIAHLRAAIGDLKEAELVAPGYQRNAVALGAITGKDGEGEAYKLAQAIHQSGAANDPVTKKLVGSIFAQKMNLYTAMIAAANGKLQAGDLLAFQKQAGSYGGSLSDQGRINLVGLIQTMGGFKSGTQLSSLNRALKDGILQKSTLNAFESVGLIDPSKVHKAGGAGHGGGGSPGGGITFAPGALKNEAQFRSDLAGWVYGTLVPSLNKAGITATADQINWIQHSKLTTNPSRILAELVRNQGVDQQEAANVRKAAGVDQYKAVMGSSYSANAKALHDAWLDMLTALGTPLIKPAIGAMQALTGALKGVAQWAAIHPNQVRLVGEALAVLGTTLIGFGVVAIGVAAFAAVAAGGAVGLAIAGVGALVGAISAIVILNWGGIKSAAAAIWSFIKSIWDVAAFVLTHPFEAMKKGFEDKHPGQYTGVPGQAATPRPSAAPTGAAPQKHALTGDVHIDGKKVGKVVWRHLNDGLDRASRSSTGAFDPTQSLSPVGLGYPA